jgi:hypothetical protein
MGLPSDREGPTTSIGFLSKSPLKSIMHIDLTQNRLAHYHQTLNFALVLASITLCALTLFRSLDLSSGRLYLSFLPASSAPAPPPSPSAPRLFIGIEDDLTYEQFYADFGPVNLAKVSRIRISRAQQVDQTHYTYRISILSPSANNRLPMHRLPRPSRRRRWCASAAVCTPP